jgi:hypothetical protein
MLQSGQKVNGATAPLPCVHALTFRQDCKRFEKVVAKSGRVMRAQPQPAVRGCDGYQRALAFKLRHTV